MNRSFHKRAITAATAVMTLTTVVTSVDAAAKNDITINADRTVVSAGESFDLVVGLDPDKVGISGFTIDLHYDTDAVSLSIPDESEYSPDSKFALVTNFEYADGIVRIVGANMTGGNVKIQTVIADLDFTVKDGYDGDIGFWTEVQDLVSTDGEEFVNAEFTAYGEYTQYKIKAEAPVTTTVPETTPTTTEPETTAEPETTPTETEPETSLPETFIPPETVIVPETTVPETEPKSETEPETESESDTEPEAELPEEYIPEDDEEAPDPEPDDDEQTDDDVLFDHKQGDEDFVGESVLQYVFDPDEYTDADGTVDIEVTVESDGTASGGIGMQTEDGWKIYSASSDGSGETVWTAEDVDLSAISGSIAVQLYYLEHDSEFKITDITITSDGDEDTDEEYDTPDEDDQTDGEDEDYSDEYDYDITPAPVDTPDDYEQDTDVPAETPDTDDGTDVPSDAVIPKNDDTAEEPEVTEVPKQEAPDTDTTTTTTVAPAAAPSSSATSSAPAANRTGSDSNPQTGSGFLASHALPFGIIALCLAQIAYSTFRLTRKEN